jgi:23S rRNA pseudouridine1911/1915/1917 synthase
MEWSIKMEKSLLIPSDTIISAQVPESQSQARVDLFLPQHFTSYSRNFFQKLIDDKFIKVNGKLVTKHSTLVKSGDIVMVHFPPVMRAEQTVDQAQLPEVSIIYEHEHFLILNKPAGLMVHAPSNRSTAITLVDWLTAHFNEIAQVGSSDRPGIVHRLDKDTSGILIVARNNYAHAAFADMFKNRSISKTYYALVAGHPSREGSIDFRIDRHPTDRNRMAHFTYRGREALTQYTVREYLKDGALLHVKPVTGRTHQIRVHCAAIGHPILGDPIYGSRSKQISRQALHAAELSFMFEGSSYTFSAETPSDFMMLAQQMRLHN